MKLYLSSRAPNPRRVLIVAALKGLLDRFERIEVDLGAGAQRQPEFLARNPFARVPVLELDDGRHLSESRAIAQYFEHLAPEPNLFGRDAMERIWIEEADRRAELYLFFTIAQVVRHTHPGLASVEQPQFPDFGRAQGEKLGPILEWFDRHVRSHEYLVLDRLTNADITAFCALEFARGLLKLHPRDRGCQALQAYRDRLAERFAALGA